MKKNRKVTGGILLLLLGLQALLLGLSGLGVILPTLATSDLKSEEIADTNQEEFTSHYSPYRIPIDSNTPLYSEIDSEESTADVSSQEPQSQYWWDTDYALTINLEKYAFVPNEDINLEIGITYNFTPVVNHQISVKIYGGYWRDYYDYYGYYYYDNTENTLIDTITVYTNAEGIAVLSLTDYYAEGLYTIYASDYNVKAYKEFTVGDHGIFVKSPRYYKVGQEFRAGVHLVELNDFSPLENQTYEYSITYYDWNLGIWNTSITGSGISDENGYSNLAFFIPEELRDKYYLQLNIQIPGENNAFSMFLYQSWQYYYYSLWGGEQSLNSDNIQYVVTTDKTLYTLGETLNLRAMVLEYSFMNETRTPIANSPIQVTVKNPDEYAIYWGEILTDSTGILTFKFLFVDDGDIGSYSIEFCYGSHVFTYSINVQYYEKPVFRVNIDTKGQMFYPDNSDQIFKPATFFEGDIVAEYYFGQFVIGATVELEISTYWGEVVYSETGVTDNNGKYHFRIKLNQIEDLSYSFDVSARVVDEYGRHAEKSQSYSRINEISVWGYVNPWAPEPGETLQLYFNAYQILMGSGGYSWNYEYNPLVNVTAEIEIYGIHSVFLTENILSTKRFITSFSGVTNNFGSGSIPFQLDNSQIGSYDYFQVKITVELEDGRSDTSTSYFKYKKYSLGVELDKNQYSKGDIIEIDASYRDVVHNEPVAGKGTLYIYDSTYQMVAKATMIFDGTEHLTYKLSNFAKEGIYYIYSYVISESNSYYGGYSYHSAYQQFEVGEGYEIVITSNITTTDDENLRAIVQSGDEVTITGTSNVPTNNLYYFEIYKRGLVYSTPIQVVAGEFEFTFAVTDLLAPDFTVFVYTISDTGKIIENYLVFRVDLESGFSLSTDKEIYEPGDEITLTITPESNSPTLIALSFIDSALLDVEPEDDSELAYFENYNYAAYLQSSSSWGVGYDGSNYWWIGYGSPNGFWYWPYCDCGYEVYDDMDMVDGGASEYENSAELSGDTPRSFADIAMAFDTEIRDNITESANWIPKTWITEETNFTFTLPDNIGEWTIRVIGTGISQEGNQSILWGDIQTIPIKSFLPFFVEYEISRPITQDDILSIKAYVYNYIGVDVDALVYINAPGMDVLNNEIQEVFIPSQLVTEVEFSLYCKNAFSQNVTILAATNTSKGDFSDAKQLSIYVQPNGLEITNRKIGFANASDPITLDYEIDENAIYHQERLALYSDLLDISLDSWESLIGYPYGCVEQTISKLLPSVLIYEYLDLIDELTPALQAEIQNIVISGLSRLYSMQHVDGGWGWWEDDESRIYMTTIVLSAMLEIDQAGFYVNEFRFESALNFLLNEQNVDGSWELESYYGDTAFEATASIVRLLIHQQISEEDNSVTIVSALDFLENQWSQEDYQGSLGAAVLYLATHDTVYEDSSLTDSLITYLLENKQTGPQGLFWTFDAENNWYWGYFGGSVEITANAIMALTGDDYLGHYPVIQKATQYLLRQKNQYGWWSTADTSAAIQALMYVKEQAIDQEIIDFNGTIDITINDAVNPFYTLNYSDGNIPSEIQLRLDAALTPGFNQITIDSSGNGSFVYVFESTQIIRVEPTVEIPASLEVNPSDSFEVAVNLTNLQNWISLENLQLDLIGLNSNFEFSNPGGSHIYLAHFDPEDTQNFAFDLIAPSEQGRYQIGNIKISADVVYQNPSDNSSTYQHFYREIGPIECVVEEGSPSSAKKPTYFVIHPLNQASPSLLANEKEGISLSKSLSKTSHLFTGDIITVNIEIMNAASNRQYYALDDLIPAGSEYVKGSLVISSELGANFESDVSGNQLHIYFPNLPQNEISISYKLQISEIKNSYGGRCELWGMYDKFSLTCGSTQLENLALQYSPSNDIYRDIGKPQFLSAHIKDVSSTQPEIKMTLNVQDENLVYKYRVYYQQDHQWNSRTFYNLESVDEIELVLNSFDNEDSEVQIIIEAVDIYGNIARYTFDPFKIFSTLPPYFTIAIIIGISMGIAGIATYLSKKPEVLKKLPIKGLENAGFENSASFSFLDSEK